ncbi:MAG: HAD-IC family P-type ATPase, partial [Patescibacteria group bacterium]|nr:HAD-IC family P-type ATPase [Patescibacteria group bacterium]
RSDIVLIKHCDVFGQENENILRLAYLNSYFQSGLENLLDKAVINHKKFPLTNVSKLDEVPYDFVRKSLSIIVSDNKKLVLINKGAPEEVIPRCNYFSDNNKTKKIDKKIHQKINDIYQKYSEEGLRVLAVAYKAVQKQDSYSRTDENNLILAGFIAFFDPPKRTAKEAIKKLEELNIKLKVISGDNELVVKKICGELEMDIGKVLTGNSIDALSDHELDKYVEIYNLFARISPLQKERIVNALKRNKHIIGFLGDGINDAPSIKAADVGISVNNATDVAKGTAQIILLEKSLTILSEVVAEGRRVFANVIKYIKMGASSNFGNMISMAGASVILPFLPMTPAQILLNNFLYDTSQLAIPTDKVDKEYLTVPRPWHINFIKKFIIFIGPVSSIFDFLTFGIMWYVFHASPELFHTGWFVESLTTQILVVHIIRTNKIPFVESWPSKTLLFATLGIILLGWILPYTFIGRLIGFQPLPAFFFIILAIMSIIYLILVQIVKKWFNKKFGFE